MRALLDTCVLSELTRPGGSEAVKRQIRGMLQEDLFISSITLGELSKGVTLLPSGRRRDTYAAYLTAIDRHFSDRILGVGPDVARIWGQVAASCQLRGRRLPAADGLIAATAICHGLHVFTRNTKDFEGTGALVVDPWGGLAAGKAE